MICGIITEVAAIAQLVERIHGKDEVSSSILLVGTIDKNTTIVVFYFFFTGIQIAL